MIPGLAGYAGGKYIDDVNQKNAVTPQDAVSQAGQRREGYNTMLQNATSGSQLNPSTTTNPILANAFQGATQQLTKPVVPPSVYSGATTQGGNAELLDMILQKALGGFQNSNINTGTNNLQTSLNNRFQPRPISNQATATR